MRLGRPPLPPHDKLTEQVTVVFTEEQRAHIGAAARTERVSISEYIRRLVERDQRESRTVTH